MISCISGADEFPLDRSEPAGVDRVPVLSEVELVVAPNGELSFINSQPPPHPGVLGLLLSHKHVGADRMAPKLKSSKSTPHAAALIFDTRNADENRWP